MKIIVKINPLHMVFAQLYGTLLGSFFNTAASFFVMDSMHDLLGTADWKVSEYGIFYNAGAIWGAIGPQRFFGIGSIYQNLLWSFLAGFLLPFIPWILNSFYPSKLWKLINFSLLASFAGPGRIQNFILPGLLVAWFFQNYMFRNHHEWWSKYTYILAVGLDIGVALTGLCVTFLQQFNLEFPIWWLNPLDRESMCLSE